MNAPRWTPGTGLTLGCIAFVTAMLAQSQDLSRVASLVPGIVVSGTLALLLVQLVIETGVFRSPDPENAQATGTLENTGDAREHRSPFSRRLLLSLSWIVLLSVSSWLLGLVAGPALFCLVFLRGSAGQTWRFSLGYAAAVLLIVASVFSLLLNATPYPGVIAGLWN